MAKISLKDQALIEARESLAIMFDNARYEEDIEIIAERIKMIDRALAEKPKYETYEDWLNEIENYGTRAERFYESLDGFQSTPGKIANGLIWLEAAFKVGRNEL